MENNHNHCSWRHYYDWRTIVKELNEKDINEILVVDNLKHGKKFQDLVDLDITEYMVRDDFLTQVVAGDDFCPIEAVSIYAPVQLRQDGIVNT